MTAATATATYRKTKSGEWVVYGPAVEIHRAYHTCGKVTVTKRDGTSKDERIDRYGKTFIVDGVEMVYGYIARGRSSYDDSYDVSTPRGTRRTRRGYSGLDYDY